MGKRQTHEFVSNYFRELGCKLLSQYVNCKDTISYQCTCGRTRDTIWSRFSSKWEKCTCHILDFPKYTHEFVNNYFNEQGCKLIDEYKCFTGAMNYQCSCGNFGKASFKEFQDGARCRSCRGEKLRKIFQFSYDYVKEYFESRGCQLLSTEYINARTHLDYICECGNITDIVFESFKIGNRCDKCGDKKSADKQRGVSKKDGTIYDLEYVQDYFKEFDCELLASEYYDVKTIMPYKCKCGNISKISLNNFRRQWQCGDCSTAGRSGENHYMWREDREKLAIEFEFRQKCYKTLKCALKRIGCYKTDSTVVMLGYTHHELKTHIYSHPNWPDVDKVNWHLDHIMPLKAFADFNISDMRLINCLDNLQPLNGPENIRKSGKYNKDEFIAWLDSKGVTVNVSV